MGPPLTDQKLTDMWRAGFCRATVEFARTTTESPSGSRERLRYLEQHVSTCVDCFLANKMKIIEYQTAEAMGPTAVLRYINGAKITHLSNFHEHFGRVFDDAKKHDPVWGTPYAQEWMTRAAARGPYVKEEEDDHETKP